MTADRLRGFFLGCTLALSGCGDLNGIHETDLLLGGAKSSVVPESVRTKNGAPFNGRAYGTFFGDRTMDCVEWTGIFVDGRPHGEFLVYTSCGDRPKKVLYNGGIQAAGVS